MSIDNTNWKEVNTSNRLTIHFDSKHNGDGISTIDDYRFILNKYFMGTQFQNVMEWCCGPAFVGFTFLADGVFRKIVCTDIEADVERSINQTLKHKPSYTDRVEFVNSDCFDSIDQKFDLIVGNPPHFVDDLSMDYKDFAERNSHHKSDYDLQRTAIDKNWDSHRKFFAHVKEHLNPGGYVILNENAQGATEETFEQMIADSGLQKYAVHKSNNPTRPFYWYMILKG